MTTTLQDTLAATQPEESVGLGLDGSFAPQDKPYWVPGVIRANYQAGQNPQTGEPYTFATEDTPARNGNGRVLRIAGETTSREGNPYNVSGRISYDPRNLTPEGQAAVKAALKDKKVNGDIKKLPTKELRTAAMQLGKLDQLQQAIQAGTQNPKFELSINGNGGINVEPLFDVAVDFQMKRGTNGYANIERVATRGRHSKARQTT